MLIQRTLTVEGEASLYGWSPVSLAYSSDIYLRIPVFSLCAFQPNGSTSNPARINRILVAHSHKTYYAANTQ